jgi:hypothetical protein
MSVEIEYYATVVILFALILEKIVVCYVLIRTSNFLARETQMQNLHVLFSSDGKIDKEIANLKQHLSECEFSKSSNYCWYLHTLSEDFMHLTSVDLEVCSVEVALAQDIFMKGHMLHVKRKKKVTSKRVAPISKRKLATEDQESMKRRKTT